MGVPELESHVAFGSHGPHPPLDPVLDVPVPDAPVVGLDVPVPDVVGPDVVGPDVVPPPSPPEPSVSTPVVACAHAPKTPTDAATKRTASETVFLIDSSGLDAKQERRARLACHSSARERSLTVRFPRVRGGGHCPASGGHAKKILWQ